VADSARAWQPTCAERERESARPQNPVPGWPGRPPWRKAAHGACLDTTGSSSQACGVNPVSRADRRIQLIAAQRILSGATFRPVTVARRGLSSRRGSLSLLHQCSGGPAGKAPADTSPTGVGQMNSINACFLVGSRDRGTNSTEHCETESSAEVSDRAAAEWAECRREGRPVPGVVLHFRGDAGYPGGLQVAASGSSSLTSGAGLRECTPALAAQSPGCRA